MFLVFKEITSKFNNNFDYLTLLFDYTILAPNHPCFPDHVNKAKCVANAECLLTDWFGMSYCICKKNYVEQRGQCKLG